MSGCMGLGVGYKFVKFNLDALYPLTFRPFGGYWCYNKAPVYADEYLVGGDGRSIHVVRTILSLGESLSAAYTARPQTFSCGRT